MADEEPPADVTGGPHTHDRGHLALPFRGRRRSVSEATCRWRSRGAEPAPAGYVGRGDRQRIAPLWRSAASGLLGYLVIVVATTIGFRRSSGSPTATPRSAPKRLAPWSSSCPGCSEARRRPSSRRATPRVPPPPVSSCSPSPPPSCRRAARRIPR